MIPLTETTTRCICDCPCHVAPRCGDIIEEGQVDCAHDCRGAKSGIVCDPFIDRVEEVVQ
jgi:hypothetical protein